MRMMLWIFIALGSASAVYAKEINLHCIKNKSIDFAPNQPEEWFWNEYKKYDDPSAQLDPEASWYLKIQQVPSKTLNAKDLKISVKSGVPNSQEFSLDVLPRFSDVDSWYAMGTGVPPTIYSYMNGRLSFAQANGGDFRGISFDCRRY